MVCGSFAADAIAKQRGEVGSGIFGAGTIATAVCRDGWGGLSRHGDRSRNVGKEPTRLGRVLYTLVASVRSALRESLAAMTSEREMHE